MSEDSQFNAAMKEAKCVTESQKSKSSYDEFTPETRKSIKNGTYAMLGMSQETVKRLMNEELMADYQLFEPFVNQTVEGKPNLVGGLYNTSFSLISKSAKQPGLRRRSDRMSNVMVDYAFGSESNNNKPKNVLDMATKQLDSSAETMKFGGSQVSNTSSQLDSPYVISQRMADSQTPMPYFRDKNQAELERDASKKTKKENAKMVAKPQSFLSIAEENYAELPIVEELSYVDDNSQRNISNNNKQDKELQYEHVPQSPIQPNFVGNREEDNVYCKNMNPSQKLHDTPILSKPMYFKIEEKQRSESDYCWTYSGKQENTKILWAKSGKSIHLGVNWCFGADDLTPKFLKIKFLQYCRDHCIDSEWVNLENVKKCEKCIKKETRPPQESFIYVDRVIRPYTVQHVHSEKGQCIKFKVPPKFDRIEFDLSFSCQEHHFEIMEKRMKRCLVAVLESSNGVELAHCLIEEVRIVAYPRRDLRAYSKKLDELKNISKIEKFEPTKNGNHTSLTNMHNSTNFNQRAHFGMESRKRNAVEMEEKYRVVEPPRNHATMLMLGMSNRAPIEQVANLKQQNDENNQKRMKEASTQIYMNVPVVGYEMAAKYFNMLAAEARQERMNASMMSRVSAHPLTYQSQINENSSIETWLNTMSLSQYRINFVSYHISFIRHLIYRFEMDSKIFERLQMAPEDREMAHKVFLNFYWIWKADELNKIIGARS